MDSARSALRKYGHQVREREGEGENMDIKLDRGRERVKIIRE